MSRAGQVYALPQGARRRVVDTIMGIVHLHSASRVPDADQCWGLLFVALGLAERSTPGAGLSRDEWIALAGEVYDSVRRALASGVQS